MSNRQEKREKFKSPKKSKASIYVVLGVLTLALIFGSYVMLGKASSPLPNKSVANIGQTVNYSPNEQLQQVKVTNKIANGQVTIATLSSLKKDRFIWTEYKGNGKRVPLTAFVQPNGKVLVAVSVCEPCKSEFFHISGNQIICNTCGTVWNLQTLKGVSGGCQDYPPQALDYSLNGDNIEVPQSVLDSWQPRV